MKLDIFDFTQSCFWIILSTFCQKIKKFEIWRKPSSTDCTKGGGIRPHQFSNCSPENFLMGHFFNFRDFSLFIMAQFLGKNMPPCDHGNIPVLVHIFKNGQKPRQNGKNENFIF